MNNNILPAKKPFQWFKPKETMHYPKVIAAGTVDDLQGNIIRYLRENGQWFANVQHGKKTFSGAKCPLSGLDVSLHEIVLNIRFVRGLTEEQKDFILAKSAKKYNSWNEFHGNPEPELPDNFDINEVELIGQAPSQDQPATIKQ